jgi:FkbM family methyltransferase
MTSALRRAGRSLVPARYRAALRRLYNEATVPSGRISGSFGPSADGLVAVTLSSGAAFRIAADSRSSVEWHLRDSRQAAELLAFARTVTRRSPGLLFDAGAHSGLFSLLYCLAHPHNQAVSFEPSAALASRIERHGRVNGVASRHAVVAKAVADTVGSRDMFADDHDGYVQVTQYAGTARDAWRRCRLETTTLDAEMARHGVPSLVKIDVEGYEWEVLQGAAGMLAAGRPTVFLELHLNFLEERGIAPSAVLALLTAREYELFTLGGRRLSPARAARSWANVLHVIAEPLAGGRPA